MHCKYVACVIYDTYMTKEMILTKKKKAKKIIIDGQKNRGQACRQGGGAEGSPALNNQLSVGLKVNGRVRGSQKPCPLSIADFRLLRTHVVLVRASVARGIIVFLFLFLVIYLLQADTYVYAKNNNKSMENVESTVEDIAHRSKKNREIPENPSSKSGNETGRASEISSNRESETDEDLVYNFKNSKKDGTITFTKKWKDNKSNNDRPVPDIEISTKKPSKNTKGYTVTFYGNGLKFADGTDTNEMVFNSSKEVVSGQYKIPGSTYVFWYTESSCENEVKVSKDGVPNIELTGDINLYAKAITFTLKPGPDFNKLIPDDVKEIIFTDEEMPENVDKSNIIDVDTDGDKGVVAWKDKTTMKVSSQIEGVNINFNSNSGSMFADKTSLSAISFNNIDTSSTAIMSFMFGGCKNLISLDLKAFDTSKVNIMSGMFYECNNLTALNISNFDTSNVVWANSMFKNCSSLTELDVSNFVTANMANMNDMFNGCKKIVTLDVSGFNTSKVIGMGYMFFNCTALTTLDVSNFDTSNVTTFVGMYSGCSNVSELDVSRFNTSKATDLGQMFYDCRKVTKLDVSNFDTSKATTLNHMFCGCSRLSSLDVSNFNTSNAKYMQYMFNDCSGLTEINVSSFDTKKVINMELMFYGCQKIKTLDLSSFETPNVTNLCNMFNMCYSLTRLDISNINSSKVTNMNWMFSNLNNLKSLSLGENFSFIGTAYGLSGTWRNSNGEEFDAMAMPNSVADTYTRIV